MERLRGRTPSPAMVVSIIALVFALAGSAAAGVATISVLNKKEKKQTRNIAKAEINKAAPGLSVASAANASALQGKPASDFATSQSEPYHEVGAPGEPAFQNGWVSSGGGFSTAAFYKDPLGVVHLKGNPFRDPGNVEAFTLPPGYRPTQALLMPMADGDGSGPADLLIQSDGDVIPECHGTPTACEAGIDGLTFRAG